MSNGVEDEVKTCMNCPIRWMQATHMPIVPKQF